MANQNPEESPLSPEVIAHAENKSPILGSSHPDSSPPQSDEEVALLEQQLAEGTIKSYSVEFLAQYYKLKGLTDKLEALYVSHGDHFSPSPEKTSFLLERKFIQEGSLTPLGIEELRSVTYVQSRNFQLGRWLDQETIPELLAIIHASRWFEHRNRNAFNLEVPPLQSALDKASHYDPDCGLLLLARFWNLLRDEAFFPKEGDKAGKERLRSEIKATYEAIIDQGEQDSLWKHLRCAARRRAGSIVDPPIVVPTSQLRAEWSRRRDEELRREKKAQLDQKRLDQIYIEKGREIVIIKSASPQGQ
jgi:hypothetical protein